MEKVNTVKEECLKIITETEKTYPSNGGYKYPAEVRVEAMKAYALLCEVSK